MTAPSNPRCDRCGKGRAKPRTVFGWTGRLCDGCTDICKAAVVEEIEQHRALIIADAVKYDKALRRHYKREAKAKR